MQKRGQAATEFLTTYGWAIIILVMVTAAILSLGVFSPKAPNECKTDAPFNCKDVVFREGGFQVNLQVPNLLDAKVDQANVKINNIPCTNVKVQGNSINDFNLKEGENKITCYGDVNKVKENSLAKAEVSLIYKSESNLEHKIKVLASGQVEKNYYNNFDNTVLLNYDFDNDNLTTSIDNSYYGNNGDLKNVILTDCNQGKCYSFNGMNDVYIETKKISPNLADNDPSSFEMWIKFNSVSSDIRFLAFETNTDRIRLVAQSGFNLDYNPSLAEGIARSNIVPQTNKWYHVVGVFRIDQQADQDKMKVYVDGQDATTSTTIPENIIYKTNAYLWLGADSGPSYFSFNGLIDNVRIYNRALTSQEIKDHYKNLKP